MKTFQDESIPSEAATAHAVVEVASLVMRLVRAEVRQRQTTGLTYSQIRSLGFLKASPGASLSEVAEHLGLQAPTTSKVIDELVQQELARREIAADDRRKVTLHATARGRRALREAVEPAQARVAELLAPLDEEEREVVERAMALLHPLFRPGGRCDRGEDDE